MTQDQTPSVDIAFLNSIHEEELVNYIESSGLLAHKTKSLYHHFESTENAERFNKLIKRLLPECFAILKGKYQSPSECRRLLLENFKQHDDTKSFVKDLNKGFERDFSDIFNLEQFLNEILEGLRQEKEKEKVSVKNDYINKKENMQTIDTTTDEKSQSNGHSKDFPSQSMTHPNGFVHTNGDKVSLKEDPKKPSEDLSKPVDIEISKAPEEARVSTEVKESDKSQQKNEYAHVQSQLKNKESLIGNLSPYEQQHETMTFSHKEPSLNEKKPEAGEESSKLKESQASVQTKIKVNKPFTAQPVEGSNLLDELFSPKSGLKEKENTLAQEKEKSRQEEQRRHEEVSKEKRAKKAFSSPITSNSSTPNKDHYSPSPERPEKEVMDEPQSLKKRIAKSKHEEAEDLASPSPKKTKLDDKEKVKEPVFSTLKHPLEGKMSAGYVLNKKSHLACIQVNILGYSEEKDEKGNSKVVVEDAAAKSDKKKKLWTIPEDNIIDYTTEPSTKDNLRIGQRILSLYPFPDGGKSSVFYAAKVVILKEHKLKVAYADGDEETFVEYEDVFPISYVKNPSFI